MLAGARGHLPDTAGVTVRYPIHGVMRRTVTVDDSGRGQVRWSVSRGAHRGTAQAQVTVDPGGFPPRTAATALRRGWLLAADRVRCRDPAQHDVDLVTQRPARRVIC